MAVSVEIGGIHASPAAWDKADDHSDAVVRETRGKEYLGSVVTASNFVIYKAATSLNWEGAQADCAKKGGALASLTNYADIKNILKHLTGGGAWVGAKNPSKTQTTWKWLTGEPIPKNFPGWAPGNPNGGEDCLSLEPGGVLTTGLHDWGCADKKDRYICQHIHG